MIADSPEKNTFSQHANVLAILTNTFPETMDKAKIIISHPERQRFGTMYLIFQILFIRSA